MIHFFLSRLCAYKSTHPTSTATFLRTRDCARACFSSAVALELCHSPFLSSSTCAQAHLCVKYLMIALTHSFLLPLHQTLGFHHRGSLPFSHGGQAKKDRFPVRLVKVSWRACDCGQDSSSVSGSPPLHAWIYPITKVQITELSIIII